MKKLGFGFMRLPLLDSNDQTNIDMDTVCKMVDVFMEKGFTYFDTAYVYHGKQSEIALRESLVKRYPRSAFTIATKMPMRFLNSKDEQESIFREQLKKCGVEFFDYYLLHNICEDHYKKAKKFDSFAFIQKKKAEGKIKNIGFSYHDNADLLDEVLSAHPEVDFVQLQINFLDWDDEDVQSRKCYEVATKHGKPVVVMEPVKGGTLAKLPTQADRLLRAIHPAMSAASWAIRFAASLDNVLTVLSGMSDMAQMQDNTNTMLDFKQLNQQERDILKQVVGIINNDNAIPCTACQYCVEGCPQNIDIPGLFARYNAQMQDPETLQGPQDGAKSAKASDCIACGQCESACPQHIEIIRRLQDVAAVFEK